MAYFNQDMKKARAGKIKDIMKKYGVKGTLGVNNHSTFVVTITSGEIDFIGNYNTVAKRLAEWRQHNFNPAVDYINVNEYWMENAFDGVALEFLEELKSAMMEGNWDKSDIQTDYFNVGWYIDITIGRWNKPYAFIVDAKQAA